MMNSRKQGAKRDEFIRESFPNMTSLIRYQIWRDGKSRMGSKANNIPTAKALSAARSIIRKKLATEEKEDSLLILRAVPGGKLDRKTFPKPPEDVESHA